MNSNKIFIFLKEAVSARATVSGHGGIGGWGGLGGHDGYIQIL